MNDKQENFIIEQQVISTLKSKIIIKKQQIITWFFCIQKEQEKMKCLHYYNKYLFKQNKNWKKKIICKHMCMCMCIEDQLVQFIMGVYEKLQNLLRIIVDFFFNFFISKGSF